MEIKYGSYRKEAEEATMQLEAILNAIGIRETGNLDEDIKAAIASIKNMKKTIKTLATDAGLAIMHQQVDE